MRVLLVTETFPPEINGVAMTTGRMVASLHRRCQAALVRHEENGLSPLSGDLETFIGDALMRLATDPELRRALGRQAGRDMTHFS